MPFSFPVPRAFSVRSIRTHAPTVPGIFGLSNSRQWILIGHTDDIQDTLLNLLVQRNGIVHGCEATGFAFEPCDACDQSRRQDRLILEYEPVGNRFGRNRPGARAEELR